MKTIKLIIHGDVIAVGFRYFAREHANRLNLRGYVRNVQDKVEIVLEGREEDINNIIELCKQGPRFSKVTNLEIKELSYYGFNNFEIR